MKWLVLIVLCFVNVCVCHQNCRGEEPRPRSCDRVCDDQNNCKIRAALLLPKNTSYDVCLPAVSPVLDLAMEDPVIKNAFPDWLTVEWHKYDVTDCDAAYAVISAIDAFNDCAHVFFGPSCDFALASVARITKFLGETGTPIMATGGFTFDFVKRKQTCQDEFYTLVRAGALGFKDIAYFIIDVMRHFNWRRVLLITEPESQLNVGGKSTCHLMMKSFANFLKAEDLLYIPWDTTSDGGLNYTENLKTNLGNKFGDGSSIIFLTVINRFKWGRTALLYDTPSYGTLVGPSGGYLLASTIHEYMTMLGFDVFGREIHVHQDFEEVLRQTVGNNYASEFFLGTDQGL